MTDDIMTSPSPTAGSTPAEMTAVVQREYGDPHDVLRTATVAVPSVGHDDVLVRVRATSVNTPDWATVLGVPAVLRLQLGLRRPVSPIRGTDVAGVVEAVGADVTDLGPGDEVFGSGWVNPPRRQAGTFAELTVTSAAKLIAKPASLSFEDAAASVMSGITALVAMRDAGAVGEGTRVLVNGASGGVGTFAVQIAKTRGAHVTGVCSGANAELVTSLGADEVVDYTSERFVDGDARYDVVLDNVMNHPPSAVARVLSDDGVLIPNSVGTGSRLLAGIPRMARAAILGFGRTNVEFARCEVDATNLRELSALLESGAVRSVIDSVHPLDAAADAIARMASHRARGNVVVVPG